MTMERKYRLGFVGQSKRSKVIGKRTDQKLREWKGERNGFSYHRELKLKGKI